MSRLLQIQFDLIGACENKTALGGIFYDCSMIQVFDYFVYFLTFLHGQQFICTD